MVTLISSSKRSSALISYLLAEDKGGHDGSAQRNLYVTGIGLTSYKTKNVIRAFNRELSHIDKHKHKVEARHLIISPSDQEIPYTSSNAQRFGDMVRDYVHTAYPNRRALICVQQDGNGYTTPEGKKKKILHAHVALCDADIFEYKAVESEKTGFRFLSKSFDNFVTTKYRIKIDNGCDMPKRRYLKGQLIAENERDSDDKFIFYQDDIKYRINSCILASDTIEEFYDNLKDFGLSVAHKIKKTGEKYQTYYLHTLDNISDFSKDKNGNIKSLAKKDQLPSMRSYRSKGFSESDIATLIKNKKITASAIEAYHDTDAENRKDFYRFCRENSISYGHGKNFDMKKFEEAQLLYKRHLQKDDNERNSMAQDTEQPQICSLNQTDPVVPPKTLLNSTETDDEMQKELELTQKRYQRAREKLQLDNTASRQKDFSL